MQEVIFTLKRNAALWKGFVIPVLYFILMVILSANHTFFFEWDGTMQYFSSTEIFSGKGYQGFSAHFWPPLYATLIGLFSFISSDGFANAKLVSMIASVLLLVVIYFFVYKLTGSVQSGLLTQLCIGLNPIFIVFSFAAQNMMLDTLFYVTAVCFFFASLQSLSYKHFLITGMIAGLAVLTRYTSYALIPAFIIGIIVYLPRKAAFANIGMILLGFVIVSAPWWIISLMSDNGLFSNWNYLNVGYGIFLYSHDNGAQWWWHDQANYDSLWEIFRGLKADYLGNVAKNIVEIFFFMTAISMPAFIIFLSLALLQNIVAKRHPFLRISNKFFIVIAICFIVYAGVIAQAFVVPRLLLSWSVLIVIAIFISAHTIGEVGLRFPKFKPAAAMVLGLFLLVELCISVIYVRNSQHSNMNGHLADSQKILQWLKKRDHNLNGRIVMATHPGWAYHLGSGFVMLPLYCEGNNVNDLLSFNHFDKKIVNYVPRFPSNLDIKKHQADYLIFDRLSSNNFLPQFSYLLDPTSRNIPENFERILLTPDAAVYRIHKQSDSSFR